MTELRTIAHPRQALRTNRVQVALMKSEIVPTKTARQASLLAGRSAGRATGNARIAPARDRHRQNRTATAPEAASDRAFGRIIAAFTFPAGYKQPHRMIPQPRRAGPFSMTGGNRIGKQTKSRRQRKRRTASRSGCGMTGEKQPQFWQRRLISGCWMYPASAELPTYYNPQNRTNRCISLKRARPYSRSIRIGD